jgi:hypothetical protein
MRNPAVKCIVCEEVVGEYHAYDEEHCCIECYRQTLQEIARDAHESQQAKEYRESRGE